MMPRGPSAWVLNLDAERELEKPDAHTPSAKTLQRMPDLLRVLMPLLRPGDVVLSGHDVLSEVAAGGGRAANARYLGRAWCPTPRALQRLVETGATPVAAPSLSVLRRVNHRRFTAELGQMLPGARYVGNLDELSAVVATESPTGQWLVKRPFGFAGRGRRCLAQGLVDPSALDFIEASLRAGEGLQVEPWVERIADYAWHGFLSQIGTVTLGEPTRQVCDDTGAWMQTDLALDLDADLRSELHASARLVAEALIDAGYFGPFGIDAYQWRDGASVRFNARSEINARYSMGWATGMQGRRVDLE
jgi:hypothetical protein